MKRKTADITAQEVIMRMCLLFLRDYDNNNDFRRKGKHSLFERRPSFSVWQTLSDPLVSPDHCFFASLCYLDRWLTRIAKDISNCVAVFKVRINATVMLRA